MGKYFKKLASVITLSAVLFLAACGNDSIVYESSQSTSEDATEATYDLDTYDLDEQSKNKLDEFYGIVDDEMVLFEENEKTHIYSDELGTIIFDSEGLDQILGNTKEDVTYDDIKDSISKLDTTDKIKEIYMTLARNLEKQYPEMELRIWYINLQSMKFEFLSEELMKVMNPAGGGLYSSDRNTIYLQEDNELLPGTLDYQIIVHEMAHPIRKASFEKDGIDCMCEFRQLDSRYNVIEEAFNSILALRSYDQTETLIGYTRHSHMIEVMLECMDNYTVQDYVNEDITYFIKKLNETNGDDSAIKILSLIDLKYQDNKDDSFSLPEALFYDTYDYVARMYYRKYLDPDMEPAEIEEVKNTLVEKLTADVSEKASLDVAHFDEYLALYCLENGIDGYNSNVN